MENRASAHGTEIKIIKRERGDFEWVSMHSRKSELERKLQTKSRKRRAINTKPLTEPLAMWDTLTVQEKHDVAAEMIEVVYISHHSEDIEIRFGI